MRPPCTTAAAALLLLCACGGIDNTPFDRGGVIGRVLRAQVGGGRVVLMGDAPQVATFGNDGTFRFDSVPTGPHQLLVVASDAEALRVPVEVRPAELADLSVLDPAPAAFIVINLSTYGAVDECSVQVRLTDLDAVHAETGSPRFVAGPLGAGCYDATMQHNGSEFWRQTDICLGVGEQQAYDVIW
ncbi:MAG TPA: hypothetical protein VND93_26595 [Myxococcales bacterium]|nr:hypothetical protein [Myxococcales bacterium]